MKKLLEIWSAPLVTIYFYAATVLTGYGYASYFNIPSNFISASLSDNIIYFFQLFTVWKYEIGLMRWWGWLIVLVLCLFIFFLWHTHRIWRIVIAFVGIAILLLLLVGCYNLGGVIAANTTSFWVPSTECAPFGSSTQYIAPLSNGSETIFIPIDENNKMTGRMLIKDSGNLNCELQYESVGKITK